MEIEAQKHLEDVRHATEMALKFTDGRTFHDYQQDDLLRSGVERQFEIIAFRNIPVYGVTSSTRVTQCFTLEKNPVGGGGAPKEAPVRERLQSGGFRFTERPRHPTHYETLIHPASSTTPSSGTSWRTNWQPCETK